MKILGTKQTRDADKFTIENEPIKSIDLMERAATKCTEWIVKRFDNQNRIKIFAGSGNNGGDGLVIARQLDALNYHVELFFIKFSDHISEDCSVNLSRLREQTNINIDEIEENSELPQILDSDILIDAIFGSGLSKSIEDFPANVVTHLNKTKAIIISIDIPSGLFGEDNSENYFKNIIEADYTLTFESPKLSFLFSENERYVGEWEVLPIGLSKEYISQIDTEFSLISKEQIKPKIKRRKTFAHKGHFGHALLIAGGYGKIGAAVLAAKGCLRAGAGLLTTHIPRYGYEILQTSVPESMLSVDKYDKVISKVSIIDNFTTIGIGPGIGRSRNTQIAIRELIEQAKVPMVIDADAINIISDNKDLLEKIPEESIFTPHPKEFERIAGTAYDNYSRIQLQKEFAQKQKVYVVLKGAYTSVACPDGSCFFNPTGNPGMATGGSGDVLTGIILSLLAQRYSSKDAALIGVFLHGLAGDFATSQHGQEAVIASDIIDNLGKAFQEIKK
ncbi:MAG: NAD(P)H-hydrate dehydratase [Bacteroidetes bacterium]|jgi:ADP-dependent NAD(P)H-hydrate dehydratase / NAD(P)H-hydrate epimerase|nr:NAD(P)H-hydrate dehydratase [Bacteroidota bacterium]MBT6687902.1 NAD(P)H-hydrate dehydratase [Bacteroidota bacterium]MBT7142450.1 NAD(P)H-hydrate dehydratase [Bacteroidota bacterium]MBT7490043.1 NAD(P)H-hydrate dehydratase [Bacteroidota bacterium]